MEHASEGLVERCPQIKGSILKVVSGTHIDRAIAHLYCWCLYTGILYICINFFYLEYKHDVMTYF